MRLSRIKISRVTFPHFPRYSLSQGRMILCKPSRG